MSTKHIAGLIVAASAAFALFASQESAPQTGPATEKRFPPLKVPPGFKATLFACDPLIEYPSVISIGPRPGAIFVAIDYMTGLGTDGKVKSEVRLIEDTDGDGYADTSTVVGKGFNSIQGLAYHDGIVYVMHAPYLTALKKSERTDLLTGLGLKPEDNSTRLHCANGVVVGHDGWLYLAQGDNGMNVVRPEGDRLVHNGGAILRCRPDGRDLHVFATGLRNIYDIALDAELNVFTRDNENDGGAYMNRVYHTFFGADHGYPYDYDERPDHAMRPLADVGLGSSAGGVCYLETQLPPAFRGNLFFCEWGKSVVRYDLKRSLAGFAPVKEIEFAAGNSQDTYPFKPTDIVVQRDGTLMISDYADGQRPKRGRGRIYHVASSAKEDSKEPGSESPLDSESHFARWEAQSALERDRARPTFDKLGSRGKLHAIWALARIDGAAAQDALFRLAESDPDAGVRAQAVRAIADLADPVLALHKLDAGRGDAKLAQRLATLAVKQDPRVQVEVTIALGRLRWAGAPDWLRENLPDVGDALSHAAMHTLRRADNWPAVLTLLDRPADSLIRRVAVHALADQFQPEVVDNLIDRLDRSPSRELVDLLARVHQKPGPWKYWGYRPGPRPANTQRWERTEAIEKALDRRLAAPGPLDRIALLKRMQREMVPVRLPTLVPLLTQEHEPEPARIILGALRELPVAETRTHWTRVVRDPKHSADNRILALDVLFKATAAPAHLEELAKTLDEGPVLADVLRRLGGDPKLATLSAVAAMRLKSADATVRAAAIETLGEWRADEGRTAVLPMLDDKDFRVRRAAASAAGKLDVTAAADRLLALLADPDLATRQACLDSLTRLREPRAVPGAIQALQVRALEVAALECLIAVGSAKDRQAVVEFARRGPSIDGLAAAVKALALWDRDDDIAEIHGTSGRLVRWHAGSPTPAGDAPKMVRRVGVYGVKDWQPLFGSGAESRVTLAAKSDGGDLRRFAYADLSVPVATPVEFLASSRGNLEVWLNGQSLHRRPGPAKYQIDSDRFSATLDRGPNRVLIAADAAEGPVEFHLHFRKRSNKAEHEKLTQAALTRGGNIERGRKLFLDQEKSQCLKCHQLGEKGERIGPELTGVGARFSRVHLIESILEPSRTLAPSFGTFTASMKNGKSYSGVKVAETESMVTLADNQGQKHVLQKADIDELQPSPVSTMPDGLEQRMSLDEFVDLIGFLASQTETRAATGR